MNKISKKQQLIDKAIELFSKHGYHGTGIDTILAQTGISKRTLYNHFASKEELIVAALNEYDGRFREWLETEVTSSGNSPQQRLESIFDVAEKWFLSRSFFGCMYITAVGEFTEDEVNIRKVCKRYKNRLRQYFKTLSIDAGAVDPDGLADEIALLFEGATVTAQVSKQPKLAAQTAKRVAKSLIQNQIKK